MTVEQYIRKKGPGISPWISKFGIPKYEFFCDFFLYTEHQISAAISTLGGFKKYVRAEGGRGGWPKAYGSSNSTIISVT